MRQYLLRRLLHSLIALWGVITIVFIILHLAGDPTLLLVPDGATQEDIEQLRRALACRPAVLIADEPTTALDVTIQAQILELIKRMRVQLQTAVILITHDLGVVADMADRVAVMYAGAIVEEGGVFEIFEQPRHPYTQLLLKSMPRLDETVTGPLHVIQGMVPDPRHWPRGCHFHPRCPLAVAQCREREPTLDPPAVSDNSGHSVACWQHQRAVREIL